MRELSSLPTVLQGRLRTIQRWATSAVVARLSGQGLVEYALLLGLIAIVVIGSMTLMGGTISELWYGRAVNAIDDILN
ncbi:MAG: Flp/Fap pilin component [Chloroflexota bacterium]|jgi:pilus assembly protein Flp/PilA